MKCAETVVKHNLAEYQTLYKDLNRTLTQNNIPGVAQATQDAWRGPESKKKVMLMYNQLKN